MTNDEEDQEIHVYAEGIVSLNAPVPTRLLVLYFVLPIWGIITFFLFWNGSWGWLDRGYWSELQKAANTTSPYINITESKK